MLRELNEKLIIVQYYAVRHDTFLFPNRDNGNKGYKR
jgi:hypothetical protein